MNQSIKGITGGTMEFFTADEIPELFNQLGWTKVELAAHMEVSTNTIARWLKGKKKNSVKPEHRSKFLALRKQLEATT